MNTTDRNVIPAPHAAKLASLAPSIALSLTRKIDPSYRWDGDGPDPVHDGFDAYDVTINARTIAAGVMFEGSAYLSGCYFRPDEPTGEVHGYLLQMLDEAAQDLADSLARKSAYDGVPLFDLARARAYLRQASHEAYEAQRCEIAARGV